MDFEATAPADNCLNPEQKNMFVVLNLKRVVVQRSFKHPLSKLAKNLTSYQIEHIDKILVQQLKDCAISVSQKNKKNVIAQMFVVKLKFASDCLLRWFNKKFCSQNLEIDLNLKIKYETSNPINWMEDRCVICRFSLQINAKGPNVLASEMSYADFYIRYEHKFLRNIYTKEELETSKELATLESYYEVFDRFLTVAIMLESAINNRTTFNEISDQTLGDFIESHCAGSESYKEIVEKIKEVQVKHYDQKIPKFSQRLYAFVYRRSIDFPKCDIAYETVTTTNFLRNVNQLIKTKTHLHHSHVTG